MFTDVRIDGTQWIVQKIDVAVVIDGASQAHSLLLPTAQVDTLICKK